MKTIGIKLADGSFFPVLEDNHPAQKALELTTAHNNQTKVMVDLYRSKTCSMDDAEYVDSLQIDNLVSHPNGEPSIAFSVSIDENSQLSANIRDPETGYQSETAIPLITRSEEELLVPDEYDISKIDDDLADPDEDKDKTQEKKQGLLSAADKMMENKKKTDLDEPIFGDDALPDFNADTGIADISQDDMFSTSDFLNSDKDPATETPNSNNENNIENQEDNFFDSEIPDFSSDLEETATDETSIQNDDIGPEETAIFDDQALADFSETSSEIPTDVLDNFEEPLEPETEECEVPVESELLNDPITDEIPQEENSEFETPPAPEDSTDIVDSLPDFDEPAPEDSTNIVDSLPDFDEPAPEDSTNIVDSLPDFDEPAPEAEVTDDELNQSLEESKALNSILSSDEALPDFGDLETDTPVVSDDNFFDMDNEDNKLPETTKQEEETFRLPDDFNDYYGSDFDQFPKTSSPIDDFSLPDFPEDNSSPELPDDFFDGFDDSSNSNDYNSSPISGAGPISFTGLYDKETEMGMSGMQNDAISKKTKVPVIICIICALICIIATAFILLAKPKATEKNSSITIENQKEITLDKNKEPESNQIKVVEEQSEQLPPPVPEAKEDEIIIIEQAEKVIPKQPEVIQEKLNDISYKVIWGDTLWDIANTYYKNPWKYTDIAKYNDIQNPDHIISGTTLVIPAE